jgi:Nuclease-related domain
LTRWAAAVAILGLGFAAIFLFSNLSGLGFGLLAADVLWVLTRIEILDDYNKPGRYTTLRGRLGVLKLVLLFAIYGAAVYGFFVIRHDLPHNARAAMVADFALAGLCFLLIAELNRSSEEALNWIQGSYAERAIGAELAVLEDQGWLVLHGYKKNRGGDIDHILCGPNGAFIIETKSHCYRAGDLRQARTNAWWLREKLGVRCWVTGVLCVNEDRRPEEKDKVWVVSHGQLVDWLQQQRNVPVDLDRAKAQLLSATLPSLESVAAPAYRSDRQAERRSLGPVFRNDPSALGQD